MSIRARFVALVAEATPTPSPTPSLREGLDPLDVSPGLVGFLVVFVIALASIVLFRSMTTKLRGVKRRGEAESGQTADDDGGSSARGADSGGAGMPGTEGGGVAGTEGGGVAGTEGGGKSSGPDAS